MSQELSKGLTGINNENRCRANGEEHMHLSNVNVYGTNKCTLQKKARKEPCPTKTPRLRSETFMGKFSWPSCTQLCEVFNSSLPLPLAHVLKVIEYLFSFNPNISLQSGQVTHWQVIQNEHNCFCLCTNSGLDLPLWNKLEIILTVSFVLKQEIGKVTWKLV